MDDDGVASPELPEWLPDGWIMKPVSRRDGSVERCPDAPSDLEMRFCTILTLKVLTPLRLDFVANPQ
ncbi:unnamed protein product [Spirodela intermedia]|uniref:Uncharacterized protein n=1 Tax=Spirodela intermedia TaxID=51605 RepID=A0A7I8IJY4_SPIIN|nr:unnamed protein product [Spirodela intermedia]CAA6658197.1 unnamed protein product [Spirodela intermedia]